MIKNNTYQLGGEEIIFIKKDNADLFGETTFYHLKLYIRLHFAWMHVLHHKLWSLLHFESRHQVCSSPQSFKTKDKIYITTLKYILDYTLHPKTLNLYLS